MKFIKKTLLTLLILTCLLASAAVTSAEDRKLQRVFYSNMSFSNSSVPSNIDIERDNEREIEPAPQPALDLPNDRVFIITPLVVCLIVLFTLSSSLRNIYYPMEPKIKKYLSIF